MNILFRSRTHSAVGRVANLTRNHRSFRKRNKEKRADFKFERRSRIFQHFTPDILDWKLNPWFKEARVRAMAQIHQNILNRSWQKNKVPPKQAKKLVDQMKGMEK